MIWRTSAGVSLQVSGPELESQYSMISLTLIKWNRKDFRNVDIGDIAELTYARIAKRKYVRKPILSKRQNQPMF